MCHILYMRYSDMSLILIDGHMMQRVREFQAAHVSGGAVDVDYGNAFNHS